ncbi:MAG: hypothetical protein ACJ79S_16210 [Gemmatimonadaceae bacterium]
MQVTVTREIGRLFDAPQFIDWLQHSPVPRWVVLGVAVLGVGASLSRRSPQTGGTSLGGVALAVWLVVLGALVFVLWRSGVQRLM